MRLLRITVLILLSLTLIIGLSQTHVQILTRQELLSKYKQADQLYSEGENIVNRKDYSEEKEEKLNRDALESFKALSADLANPGNSFDSLSFFVHLKTGVLEHYFDNFQDAKKGYTEAINLKSKLPSLPDSLLFKPYLYLGIILYNGNYFDSSLSIYKKAEKIAQAYSAPLQDIERLYNTLGALYYETGNYSQAKNYTEKSLEVIPLSNPYFKELVVNYKINLASILTRLEEFDEANKIYQELLPLNINKDIVLHNTGVINLKLGAIDKALTYFRRVNYTDTRRYRLYNDFAIAFINAGKNDSGRIYLSLADQADTNTTKKTVTKGQTNQTWGDLLVSENKFEEALFKYQSAILNYYPGYTENDIYKNPTQFSGVFSYINLFNTLTSKAETFKALYDQKQDIKDLKASIDAYSSAFKLADYVEKSYDSDEARLFLNRIKYGVHSKPIDASLLFYEITKDENYLEQAWQFDQMNKASILSYNIYENEIRNRFGLEGETSREKTIRSALTRLSLKASTENDPKKLSTINSSIRDYEIELGKIQDTISAGSTKSIRPAIPSAKWIQKNLLDKKTALLSYHLSDKELLIICITKRNFVYKKVPAELIFYSTIDSIVRTLHNVTGEDRFGAEQSSQRFYSWTITPIDSALSNIERLIIIPDDELSYIPFESLLDQSNNYLAERFSIQYQYSASLLEKRKRNIKSTGILSFAPFANFSDNSFSKLTYSIDEIKDLQGKQLIDKEASKENFMASANKFPVIHLATHAQVNDRAPSRSFIAFSKGNADSVSDRLYAQEIYDLTLDSTKLVILSACETGTGQLVHGEGMMSLSRAFAYAGCPDIVTSLWKAEDKTTAFLMKRFHFYLSEKKTTDQALQLAKLDLLKSNEIDERLKSPNYWAHIIFIGEYQPLKFSYFKWWFFIPALFPALIWFTYRQRKKN